MEEFGNKSVEFDFTHSIILVNYSVTYEYWVVNNRFPDENELTIYGGLGITNYFNIQFGLSSFGSAKIRARSVIDPLDYHIPWSNEEQDWWTNISFTVDLEHRLGRIEGYSLGFGISYIIYNDKPIFQL